MSKFWSIINIRQQFLNTIRRALNFTIDLQISPSEKDNLSNSCYTASSTTHLVIIRIPYKACQIVTLGFLDCKRPEKYTLHFAMHGEGYLNFLLADAENGAVRLLGGS